MRQSYWVEWFKAVGSRESRSESQLEVAIGRGSHMTYPKFSHRRGTVQLFPRLPLLPCQRCDSVLLTKYCELTHGKNADFRQDPYGEDHHPRGGVFRHNRKCQIQNSGQGGVNSFI